MDLKTLTRLSRQQLDLYAAQIGVPHPERLSHAALLTTLLGRGLQSAEQRLERTGAGGAVQVARGVLSVLSRAPLLRNLAVADLPPARSTPRDVAPAPKSQPTATPTATTSQPAGPTSQPAAQPTAQLAEPEPQPHDDDPHVRHFVQEPIRTRSMARLLLAQGHRARALAILESITQDDPGDLLAREDLERVRSDVPLDPDLARLPEPVATPVLPDTGDHIALEVLPGRELRLQWLATDAGRSRASAVLGSEGELAVRLVAITPDPTRVVRSEITERGPVDPDDSWTAITAAPGSRCFAAIGVRAGGRFVAIVHAPPQTIA